MIFAETSVKGAFVMDIEPRADERGFFARAWCTKELSAHGLTARIAQASLSYNTRRGTLRGMHLQEQPHEEAKVVSCTHGVIYDVVLDLRRDSPTFLRWAAAELTADNRRALYIPEGCAHGFQTLSDEAQVLYLISEFYAPGLTRGVRYDDPAFAIRWPLEVTSISPADLSWPKFAGLEATEFSVPR